MKTRFAPSPTGLMHYGNVRTALFNYLYAKAHSGEMLLRIEDTDAERSKEEYVSALKEDLAWLGMAWNDVQPQSQRKDIYDDYYNELISSGKAYPCFCSQEQLAISRKAQLSQGLPPRYSGTCRNLSTAEALAKEQSGLKPTLRFKIDPDSVIEFEDLIKGTQKFLGKEIGDFIIRRADGSSAFMFSNAVDDALMDVTHAFRGEDHLTNTPRQLLILKALGLSAPSYGHFPLIVGQDSAPLSKRNGSETVVSLRDNGFFPIAINNYLARLGHSGYENNLLSMEELASQFSLSKISKSPARHDRDHLLHWQKDAMMLATDAEVTNLLQTQFPEYDNEKLAQACSIIKPNLNFVSEAKPMLDSMFAEQIDYTKESIEILKSSKKELFEVILANRDKPYKDLLMALKSEVGVKGKSLFMPLRACLTGMIKGPELEPVYSFLQRNSLIQARASQVLDFIG